MDAASWGQRLRRVPAPVVDAVLAVALGVAIAVAITVGPRQGREPDAAAYASSLVRACADGPVLRGDRVVWDELVGP